MTTVEVTTIQIDNGIVFPNQNVTPITYGTPIQGQICGCETNTGIETPLFIPLGMYMLQLDETNYFGQTAPGYATNPFPLGDGTATTGYIDFNVWFPNLTLPIANEPVAFFSTDVGAGFPAICVSSAGNNGTGLIWTSSAGITQLSVILYAYSLPFVAYVP